MREAAGLAKASDRLGEGDSASDGRSSEVGAGSRGEAGVAPRRQGLCLEWSSVYPSSRTVTEAPTPWDPWPKFCRAEG